MDPATAKTAFLARLAAAAIFGLPAAVSAKEIAERQAPCALVKIDDFAKQWSSAPLVLVICGDAADGNSLRAELSGTEESSARRLKSCVGAFPCAFVPPGQAGIAGELKSGQVLLLSPDGKTKVDCGLMQKQKGETYGDCLLRLLSAEDRVGKAWRERRTDATLQSQVTTQIKALGGAAKERRDARKWLTENLNDCSPMLLAAITSEDPETASSAQQILATAAARDVSGLPRVNKRGNMDPRIACGMARISPVAHLYLSGRPSA